ncbi:macrophage colony-stimulating factor 1a isoform X2 [Oncorhynchus keta]|uniref:macrophage colony-stimulating factor 1a isoform X2 n=1 Tax=Oncorhynchus keta TaxID=8018 RepID=UPI00227B6BEE|nr:macrophage colony-stimulating factor 1a isoform X2 [Oncorhynchus keta]
MNTHKPAHKAKARHLCFVVLLCFPLAWAGVPGPCRHSVTKGHLLNLNRLIDNQLENGCSITYVFTELQSLSEVCYVKAALPQILELLNTNFNYVMKSDNGRYVKSLKKVIYNFYSHNCIPEINEEIEDNPVKFVRLHSTSPREALRKARGVIEMYRTLMTKSNGPVDWNCEEEYAEDYSESATVLPTQTKAEPEPEHQCACPTVGPVAPDVSLVSHGVWSSPPQPTLSQPTTAMQPRPPHPLLGTHSADPGVFLGSPGTVGPPSLRGLQVTVPDGHSLGEGREGELHWDSRPPPPTGTESDSALYKTGSNPLSATDHPLVSSPPSLVLLETVGSKDKAFYYPQTERAMEASADKPAGRGAAGSPHNLFVVPRVKLVTPVPFLYKVMGITLSSDESTAYVLAKRSLDARNYGIYQDGVSTETLQLQDTTKTYPSTERYSHDWNHPIGSTTTEASPHLKMTEEEPDKLHTTTNVLGQIRKTESKHTRTYYEKVLSTDILSEKTDVDDTPISERPSEGSEKKFQNGKTGHYDSSTYYQTAFIIGAMCGGFLLITTLFSEKKRLRALIHSANIIENQRACRNIKGIELQYYKAKD